MASLGYSGFKEKKGSEEAHRVCVGGDVEERGEEEERGR